MNELLNSERLIFELARAIGFVCFLLATHENQRTKVPEVIHLATLVI